MNVQICWSYPTFVLENDTAAVIDTAPVLVIGACNCRMELEPSKDKWT